MARLALLIAFLAVADAKLRRTRNDQDDLAAAKLAMEQRLTAGLKDIHDDPAPPAQTTTTTTIDPQAAELAALKVTELTKLTAGVAEAHDDVAPTTTTTTEDPQKVAEHEKFDQLKAKEMSLLTANLDDASIEAAEKTATTTTTTTTSTVTLGEAGKKVLAEISSGKFVLPTKQFAGLQTSEEKPEAQEKEEDEEAASETMTDLDTYGF